MQLAGFAASTGGGHQSAKQIWRVGVCLYLGGCIRNTCLGFVCEAYVVVRETFQERHMMESDDEATTG